MRTGFDELVEQLLYDVALSGNIGIGAAELSKAVKRFYKARRKLPSKESHVVTTEDSGHADLLFSDSPPTKAAIVDEPFLDAVWYWLERHPDVEIVDEKNSATTAPGLPSTTDAAAAITATPASRHAGKRILANEDRTWQAITGHGVDHARIPPTYFECLNVIAAHGPDGILQPDLRRITGQDKRSLPHRTDVLAKEGYISKEQVVAKSTNTTLLKLQRFAKDGAASGPQHVRAYPESKKPATEVPILSYDTWYDETMRLLIGNNNIMTVADLLIGLHIFDKQWETQCFRRCYNRLVDNGCLRKLSARVDSGIDGGEDEKWARCIQLLRKPTETDRYWFKKSGGPDNVKKLVAAAKSKEAPHGEADDSTPMEVDDPEVSIAHEQRSPPQWTPNLPYPNLIYNVLTQAGPAGLSSVALNEQAFGLFWRRPMEEAMLRLTDIWQHSQPAHLKHLSIIRDTAMNGKQSHFNYRTFENFQKAVEIGQTAWEAVLTDQKANIKAKKGRPTAEAGKLDAWGFPLLRAGDFAGGDGRASLVECQQGADGQTDTPTRKPGRKPATPAATASTPSSKPPRFRNTSIVAASNKQLPSQSTPAPPVTQSVQPLNLGSVANDGTGQLVDQSRAQILRHTADNNNGRKRKRTAKAAELDDELEDSANKVVRIDAPQSQFPTANIPLQTPVTTSKPKMATISSTATTPGDPATRLQSSPATTIEINPPGSYPRHLIKPGRRKQVLVAVVKSTKLGGVNRTVSDGEGTENATAGGQRSAIAPQSLPTNNASAGGTQRPAEPTPTSRGLSLAYDAEGVPLQPAATPHERSLTITRSNKRPHDDAEQGVERQGSPPPPLQTLIHLPKRRKVGRPTKAEAAERDRLRAQITESDGSIAITRESLTAPGQRRSSLMVKLPVTSPYADEKPASPFPSAAWQQPKPTLVVKLPTTNSWPAATLADSTGGQIAAVPISPQSKVSPPQEDNGLVVKLPIPRSASLVTTGPTVQDNCDATRGAEAALSANNVSKMPEELATHHNDTNNDMRTPFVQDGVADDGVVADDSDDEADELEDSRQASILFDVDPTEQSSPAQRKYGKAGTTRDGGIIQLRRAKIVQDVVRKAGGAFPGDYEMWYPFVTHWQRLYSQTPDRNTVEHAINGLVQQGKLKKFGFTFKDDGGKKIQRHVIVEPNLDATSWKAKAVQENMINAYPYRYLPRSVEIEKHLRDKAREVPTTTTNEAAHPTPADDSDEDYTPQEPGFGQYPGTIPVEFPIAADVTVKRTVAGIAAVGKKGEPKPKKVSRPQRTPMQYRRRVIVQDGKPYPDNSDEDDSDAELCVSSAQAALMSSFQMGEYVHDPTAVPTKMYWPRPRQTMGPRSETPSATKAFKKRLQMAQGSPQKTTRSLSETPEQDSLQKRSGPKAGVSRFLSDGEQPYATAKDLDDLLQRAEALGHQAANNVDSLFWQFQVEVDRVMALELALLKKGTSLLGEAQGWTFVNHGLNRSHITDTQVMPESGFEFVDGTLSPQKAENLRKSLLKTKALQTKESLDRVRRRSSQSTTPAASSSINTATSHPPSLQPASIPQTPAILTLPRSGATISGLSHNPLQQQPLPPIESSTTSPYNTRFGGQGRPKMQDTYDSLDSPDDGAAPDTITESTSRRRVFTTVEQEHLAIAVALFNTLCGGVERDATPKWNMIAHALSFQASPENAKQRWKTQARGNMGNGLVQRLEDAIREPFLVAYEEGNLPSIDFNNLEKTNWPALVRWVEQTVMPLDNSAAVKTMPLSRESLVKDYSVKVAAPVTDRKDDEDALPIITASRSMPAAKASLDHNSMLEKSWIRALTATDQAAYREQQAAEKLSYINPSQLAAVVEEMKQSKTIRHASKGRQQPGRNFIFTPHFFAQFDRWSRDNGAASQFVKEVSSAWGKFASHFEGQDKLELKQNVSEAEMMVLNSLLALGYVRIVPVLPTITDDVNATPGTLSKWGMGGYSRKAKVDESLYQLSVVYTKTSAFSGAHGLKRNVPIPTQPLAVLGELGFRVPLWVDIHGNFVPEYWKMALRSVLYLLVHKPGCTVRVIEQAHDTKLWAWEIELLLQWMEVVGAAMRCGSGREVDGKWNGGWRAGEWWFAAFLPEVVGSG